MKVIAKKWKEILFILIVIIVIGFAASKFLTKSAGDFISQYTTELSAVVERSDIQKNMKFPGTINPNDSREVYSLQSAKVEEVLVQNGDFVKAGDPLVRLDTTEIDMALRKNELALQQAEIDQRYAELEAKEELADLQEALSEDAEASVLAAQQELLNAQLQYESILEKYNIAKADLANDNSPEVVAAKQELATAQNNYSYVSDSEDFEDTRARLGLTISQAQVNLRNARDKAKETVENLEHEVLEAETNVWQKKELYDAATLAIEQAKDRKQRAIERIEESTAVETAKIDIDQANQVLEHYTITAPIDGYIADLDVKVGDNLENSKCMMLVQNFDSLKLKIDVDEYSLKFFEVGTTAHISVRALEKEYDGVVSEISRTAIKKNDTSYLVATVSFQTKDLISSGLGAEVLVPTEHAEGVLALPVDAVLFDEDTFEPYVVTRDQKGKDVEIPVTLGISDGEKVEITSGVSEGDEVFYTTGIW